MLASRYIYSSFPPARGSHRLLSIPYLLSLLNDVPAQSRAYAGGHVNRLDGLGLISRARGIRALAAQQRPDAKICDLRAVDPRPGFAGAGVEADRRLVHRQAGFRIIADDVLRASH